MLTNAQNEFEKTLHAKDEKISQMSAKLIDVEKVRDELRGKFTLLKNEAEEANKKAEDLTNSMGRERKESKIAQRELAEKDELI